MIEPQEITVVSGEGNVETFDVSTAPANQPGQTTTFDLGVEGVERITVSAGNKTLGSDTDPLSVQFSGASWSCRFSDLALAPGRKYAVFVRAYKPNQTKPLTLVAPGKESQITLVWIA